MIMTFDSAPLVVLSNAAYIEDGIKMSVVVGHYDISQGLLNGGLNDTKFVFIDSYNEPPITDPVGLSMIKFEMADGSNFDLKSIYLVAPLQGYGDSTMYAGKFDFSNGSSIIPAHGDGMAYFYGYANLSWFTYSVNTPGIESGGSGLDSIDMSPVAPVPEPSRMILVKRGLAGRVGYGKRRAIKERHRK